MGDRRWERRFWLLLAGLTALRVAAVFCLPLDLSPDEAYYWEWSRRLAWGYYSKPPLIAWVIWPFAHLPISGPGSIRLAAALLATLTTLATFLLGRAVGGRAVGFWAALLSAAVPASAVLALIITIDAPLMALWTLSLYLFWRAVQGGHRGWWPAVGLTAGLALLAKQTAAAFWPLAFLFLAATPSERRWLRSPWPYLACLISLLMLVPTLAWNMRHGWITLHHTSHHFRGIEGQAHLSPASLLTFVGSQIGVLSPLIWLGAWLAMVAAARRWASTAPEERFLILFSLPPLAGITGLSLLQRVNANWPAPFYAAALVLLAMEARRAGWPRLLRPKAAAALGGAMTLLLYAGGLWGNRLPWDPALSLIHI